ncbi:MAG TPA: hypothetical protein VGM90_33850 [Kofleriaceae bacterium]|jgi:hypothetical protein
MRGFRAVVLGVVAVAGCSRTFSGHAVQANPLANPLETLPTGEKITIVRGDMDLERPDDALGPRASYSHNHHYPLLDTASFSIVTRDRLRFHVQIDHKWQEYADLNSWSVHLEDNAGHRWDPEAVEDAKTRIITSMWDREQRTSVCSRAGRSGSGDCYNTIGFLDDGYRRRMTLGSLSVYRGTADFVFYERDIFNPQVRQMKLVVSRPGESFEFVWDFEDQVASTSE